MMCEQCDIYSDHCGSAGVKGGGHILLPPLRVGFHLQHGGSRKLFSLFKLSKIIYWLNNFVKIKQVFRHEWYFIYAWMLEYDSLLALLPHIYASCKTAFKW